MIKKNTLTLSLYSLITFTLLLITGSLYANGQVSVDDETTKYSQQGEYTSEESSALKKEDQTNSSPIGELQGNWRLVSDGQLLLKTQLIHNKGTDKAEGGFIAHEEIYLGRVKNEAFLHARKNGKSLNLSFDTSKGRYSVKLSKNTAKYNDLGYSEVWNGTITFPDNSSVFVLFGKIDEAAEITAIKKQKSHLYDLSDPNNQFIFSCKQKVCFYDYINEGISLKNIPLLKGWAITEPFYNATAGSGSSKYPIIEFVNTTNGLWMTLNPRMVDPKMLSCIEFGKNGRLSSEERICYINEEAKKTDSGNRITLLENIEFWRSQFYQ